MSSAESISYNAQHAADPQIEQAIAQLIEGDFHSKWDRTKRLDQQFAQWGDRPIPYLISRLENSTDVENQWFLVRALAQFDHPKVVAALAHLLMTPAAEDLQVEAIKALTGLGNSAVATLAAWLSVDQLPARRVLAAQTLARIRRTDTILPLLSVADDPDPQLRAIAVEALGSFHDARVTPILLAALKDSPQICVEAIRTLGRRADLLGTVDLVGPLQRCLYHADATVARESAVALGRLGSEPAAIALGKTLTQPLPTSVKIAAVRALGWMDTPTAIADLSAAFAGAMPTVMPPVRQEIAKSLGQTRSDPLKAKAAAPLLTWLKSANLAYTQMNPQASDAVNGLDPTDLSLNQAVISALARLRTPAALDGLVPLLGDPDARIGLHALSALKQIDSNAAQIKVRAYLQDQSVAPHLKRKVADTLAAW